MQGVIAGFSVIAVVIGIGYLLGRTGTLGPSGRDVLSTLAFFVATPALLFETLATADVGTVFSPTLVVTVASTVVAALVFVLVSWLVLRRSVAETTIGALTASYVNAGNLGIPISVYVLGDAAYAAPIMIFQLVVMTPLSFAVLDTATAGRRRSLWRVFAQPLRNPVTIASFLGLGVALAGLPLPELVLQPFQLVGAMAVPAMLLAFGISLHGGGRPGSGRYKRDLWTAVALKNLLQPVVAFLLARYALGLEGTMLLAATITAALPTAQNIFVYAIRYDRAVDLARDAILITTVVSVPVIVTITALLAPG
ncbi:AEC family transporter [Actinoalloteichus sp. AHMU CJ021]|uniref:Permease n=1 Tax=Actinoalloteichus caeruleus DSM 43889 TaxID=1120930 RepID=A0ABT1JL40_ACTCY|nr:MULTISPECIES: AEC family transporter [Actinoalloteichus]AUS79001.1 AEC family transporter [Actinoalloteichus sp. AHMU CJ021]MCP2333228.1 hypothetical protein [Actinoalloteichus caeruleus DSM 43889]